MLELMPWMIVMNRTGFQPLMLKNQESKLCLIYLEVSKELIYYGNTPRPNLKFNSLEGKECGKVSKK